MPIHRGQDETGSFYQWGQTGKKYYFDPENTSSKTRALNKAKVQQTAIYSSGWKGDEKMKMKLIKVKRGDVAKAKPVAKKDAPARLEKVFKMYTAAGMALGGALLYYREKNQELPDEEKAYVKSLIVQLSNVLEDLKKKASK